MQIGFKSVYHTHKINLENYHSDVGVNWASVEALADSDNIGKQLVKAKKASQYDSVILKNNSQDQLDVFLLTDEHKDIVPACFDHLKEYEFEYNDEEKDLLKKKGLEYKAQNIDEKFINSLKSTATSFRDYLVLLIKLRGDKLPSFIEAKEYTFNKKCRAKGQLAQLSPKK